MKPGAEAGLFINPMASVSFAFDKRSAARDLWSEHLLTLWISMGELRALATSLMAFSTAQARLSVEWPLRKPATTPELSVWITTPLFLTSSGAANSPLSAATASRNIVW